MRRFGVPTIAAAAIAAAVVSPTAHAGSTRTHAEPVLVLNGGKVVMEAPRHVVLVDTFNHLAHHRGQLTVYLRLLDQKVPAIYGPSADDPQFA